MLAREAMQELEGVETLRMSGARATFTLKEGVTFEEKVVFPRLIENGAGDMTRLFVEEHRAIRPLSRQLRGLAADALDRAMTAEQWEIFRPWITWSSSPPS